MMRVIRSLWIWTAGGLLIAGWTLLVALVRLADRNPHRLRTARTFRRLGPVIARVNPWRIHIAGQEHLDRNRVYVIVSNHQSLADIPLIAHLRFDAKWLAKAELFRVPFVGWMMSMSDDVPVARSDRRKAAHALLQCARYLRQGCSVVFFPEGTRSRDGHVLPFNDGPFQLAIREQVAVLPLVVDGSRDALPRNSWLFSDALDIHLRVLEPVPVEGMTVKESATLRETVRQCIIDELCRIRSHG
jgi:1-acyl-sn-glycerol-3-phosphate acyltransferase